MKIAVIVGAGLATRLHPITQVIPKVLVNNGQDTILKGLIDTYSNLDADRIIVIVPPEFENLTLTYLDQENLNCEVRTCDQPIGSAYAIQSIFDELKGHNVVFNWSDVLPEFIQFRWNKDVVYTYGDKCRYAFVASGMREVGKTGGNVVGVYQVAHLNDLTQGVGDFVEAYDFSSFVTEDLSKLIDIGDLDKLKKIQPEYNRAFNKIEYKDNVVRKIALTEQGRILQKREVEWYKKAEVESPMLVPDIFEYLEDDNTIVMERIDGRTLAEAIKIGEITVGKAMRLLRKNRGYFTKVRKSNKEMVEDFHEEFLNKVFKRNNSIANLIQNFAHIKYVNNVPIGNAADLLQNSFHYLLGSLTSQDSEYACIHGDLNFSNILLEFGTDNLIAIDPRGYFGHTELYGPPVYDHVKILYALSGYDHFNSDPAYAGTTILGNEMFINIQPLALDWPNFANHDREHLMVAIVWMALAGYFKNNPYKAITAFFYGLYMMTVFWNNFK